jgi:hypothetical protein
MDRALLRVAFNKLTLGSVLLLVAAGGQQPCGLELLGSCLAEPRPPTHPHEVAPPASPPPPSGQVIVTAPGALFAKGADLFNALVEASGKLKGKVVLVTAKTESDNGKPIVDYFGLDVESKEPQVGAAGGGYGFRRPSSCAALHTALSVLRRRRHAGAGRRSRSGSAGPRPHTASFLP